MDVEKYVNSIFAYCIKRTRNLDDAEDLTQDIICEVLRAAEQTEIKTFDAWLWKVAHNRYARYLNGKKHQYISIYENGLIDMIAEEVPADSSLELQSAFTALHSIAKMHRDLLVDRYVNELTYAELSKKYNLLEGTVKTRLHYGKIKLRERWQHTMENNKVYEKINWFISGNGDVDISYIERQIPRAIVSSCYERAMSIEDISVATGIPCLYIEDEIPVLLKGEIISKQREKYISNIIIHSEDTTAEIEKILLEEIEKYTNATVDILAVHMQAVREIGFYGSQFADGRLWWSIIPMLWREACEEARRKHGKTARCAYPPRLDGGKGWIFADVSRLETRKYFSGCNGYFLDNSKFFYYWSSKYFSENLNAFLYRLESCDIYGSEFNNCGFDELLTAECIKYGLARNGEWSIPIFTAEQYGKFRAVIVEMAGQLSRLIYPQVEEIYELMRRKTPKHLHEQIRGVFGAQLNSVIAMICDEMEMKGLIDVPKEEYFTGQIVMCLK